MWAAKTKDYSVDKTDFIICSVNQFSFNFWVTFESIQQLQCRVFVYNFFFFSFFLAVCHAEIKDKLLFIRNKVEITETGGLSINLQDWYIIRENIEDIF